MLYGDGNGPKIEQLGKTSWTSWEVEVAYRSFAEVVRSNEVVEEPACMLA
jgi:hypothetical protein